jgi:hypothetical protein
MRGLQVLLSRPVTRLFAQQRPSGVIASRGLASAASPDILQSLYLSTLKSYKAPKALAKAELPETFTLPSPPPVPAFDKTEVAASASGKLEEEAWPALYDPIDDPNNYNGVLLLLFSISSFFLS